MEWVIKPLGELVTFERGLTYSKSDEAEFSSNGVLRSNNVDLETSSLNLDEIKYLKADFVIPSSKKAVRNSLLMCMSNGSKSHLGKVALIEDDLGYAFGGFMGLLKPIDTVVLPRYLYYSLISPAYKKHIQSLSDGANINNLKYKDLSVFPVMFPTSLSEQQRIVDILDAEFAKIDALKENAEKNLQNAKDLFQAVLRKELEPKEGWNTASLSELYDVRDGTHDSPKYVSTGYPFVTSKNLKNGEIDMSDVKYISKADFDKINERSKVDKGDVLFAMIGSNLGHPALVVDEPQYAIKNVALFKVPTNMSGLLLTYLLSSDIVMNKVNKEKNGSSQPFVSLKYLRDFIVSVPKTLKEQEELASAIKQQDIRCQTIIDHYYKTCLLCNDLKQALLRKAFNGEL